MRIPRNIPCPCGSGTKYKKCCFNKEIGEKHSARLSSIASQLIPWQIGSAEENSSEFNALEDWASSYLSSINPTHPLFAALSNHLMSHAQIIDLARHHGTHDYLKVAELLYENWLNS